jgi:hypothetical protein
MGTLLNIMEKLLDRCFMFLEWARDAHEDYLQRKRLRDCKADIDLLGMQIKTHIEDSQLVRCRVISLPRHSSKVH